MKPTDAPIENLVYNNPLGQKIERCWYKREIFFYLDLGPVVLDLSKNKTADIYRAITGFGENNQPLFVEDQYNIFDTIPGDPDYSPLWRVNLVVVPPTYIANSTLRSKEDVQSSGFQMIPTNIVIN